MKDVDASEEIFERMFGYERESDGENLDEERCEGNMNVIMEGDESQMWGDWLVSRPQCVSRAGCKCSRS